MNISEDIADSLSATISARIPAPRLDPRAAVAIDDRCESFEKNDPSGWPPFRAADAQLPLELAPPGSPPPARSP
ncbi:hypothetical protein HUT16_33695 [Kitasatospora sp. NA04385]|uniref:hypothetical protein n=1 Tax=Kitasatospora sp. NA04385 TaxID=2742135 RepID=UPI001591786E|nr:hypothetical protein [Kitasatospora sp. NA04385]QKW23382.1 hypothetical protein HUT16_33695 [Kitasatospora sp. NA04385]